MLFCKEIRVFLVPLVLEVTLVMTVWVDPHSVKSTKYSANTRCCDNSEVHPNTVFKVVAFLSLVPIDSRRRGKRKEEVQEDQRGGGGWGGERRGGSREGGGGGGEEYEEVVTASGYKTLL